MRIFITGATGFVGRNLVSGLRDEHEVFAHSGRASGDLRQPLDLASLPSRADVVIHTAGLVGATDASRELYVETNVTAAVNVARAAAAMKAGRFLLLSTGGVYRQSPTPLTEESEIAPRGDYAVSKWEGERAVAALDLPIGLQIARLFFPYGPGQTGRLVPRLIQHVRNGEPIVAAGGEGPAMNPIYIDDLVESIRRLLTIDEPLLVNLAGPEIVSIRGLAERIGRLVGAVPTIVAKDEEPESWVAAIAHAVRLTGYVPAVAVDEGLRRISATIS
jgi:UDP-glucose 4-epimerase